MLRETTFLVGGALTIALGIVLAVGLVWAGAGWDFLNAYLASLLAVGFGVGFMGVGRAEGRERRRALAEAERASVRAGEQLR
ncbi:MAG: hypothetical protein WB809_04510 [Thermoplasmata archaeon]